MGHWLSLLPVSCTTSSQKWRIINGVPARWVVNECPHRFRDVKRSSYSSSLEQSWNSWERKWESRLSSVKTAYKTSAAGHKYWFIEGKTRGVVGMGQSGLWMNEGDAAHWGKRLRWRASEAVTPPVLRSCMVPRPLIRPLADSSRLLPRVHVETRLQDTLKVTISQNSHCMGFAL